MNRLLRALGWIVVAFIAAPLVIVIPMSFSNARSLQFPPPGYGLGYYRAYFSDPSWLRPTYNSLLIALAVTLLTLALVLPACFALVRHRFHGKAIAQLLLLLPLAVPQIVMAVGYYALLGKVGLVQTHLGVILAHTCLALPIAFLVLSANLKGFDRSIERAAQSLGASPLRTLWHVTLPILRPGLLVAALFAFITSFDEAVVALFISGADAETLPRKMFASIREQSDPVIAVVSTLLFALVLLVLAAPALAARTRRRPRAQRAAAAALVSLELR